MWYRSEIAFKILKYPLWFHIFERDSREGSQISVRVLWEVTISQALYWASECLLGSLPQIVKSLALMLLFPTLPLLSFFSTLVLLGIPQHFSVDVLEETKTLWDPVTDGSFKSTMVDQDEEVHFMQQEYLHSDRPWREPALEIILFQLDFN